MMLEQWLTLFTVVVVLVGLGQANFKKAPSLWSQIYVSDSFFFFIFASLLLPCVKSVRLAWYAWVLVPVGCLATNCRNGCNALNPGGVMFYWCCHRLCSKLRISQIVLCRKWNLMLQCVLGLFQTPWKWDFFLAYFLDPNFVLHSVFNIQLTNCPSSVFLALTSWSSSLFSPWWCFQGRCVLLSCHCCCSLWARARTCATIQSTLVWIELDKPWLVFVASAQVCVCVLYFLLLFFFR